MNLPLLLALAVEVLSLTTNNNKLTEFFNRTKKKTNYYLMPVLNHLN